LTRLIALAAVLAAGPAAAQPPELRWGCDPTGGAPFIMQDAAGNYTGFEYELAQYLGAKLGRKPVLVDGTWANLPQQLTKSRDVEKGVDVILNGYELRKDLSDQFGVSRAYYAYRVTLLARRDDAGIRGWDDLKGKAVGVLGGTVCHDYVRTHCPGADVQSNEDVANVMKLVADRRLPATAQDSPAAAHFQKEYPALHAVAQADQPGYYVIYYRKGDTDLGRQLDAAIADGLRDGSLRRIYEKYGLWNADQEALVGLLDKPWPPTFEEATGSPWPRLLRELVRAAGVTLQLSFASFPLAVLLGLLVAVGRVYGPGWLAGPLGVYVEVVRGTPLLLQLYVLFYLLPVWAARLDPALGELFSPLLCGILGLAVNYSAYEAENYRAGLLAVPRGQMEAALALGMTRWTAIRRVVVPQAVRIVIPPVTNDFIALFKDTSVCSAIMITELTRKYNELYNFNRNLILELALITAGLYLLMSYPLGVLARHLERRLAGDGGRA
jgi:polar amino acid transport system substrate-binding protein